MTDQLPTIREVRLHLGASPDFTSKGWGRKVKALGGRFGDARGQAETRYVYVPASPAGLALASKLIAFFPRSKKTTVVLQVNMHEDWIGFTASSGVVVYDIPSDTDPWAVALQLSRVIARFEQRAGQWWADHGADEAIARREHKESVRRDRLDRWPSEIAKEVGRALAEGVPSEDIQAALDRVFNPGRYS